MIGWLSDSMLIEIGHLQVDFAYILDLDSLGFNVKVLLEFIMIFFWGKNPFISHSLKMLFFLK